jgi:CBS domain-containing protein
MCSAVQAPRFVRPIKSSDLDRHTSNGLEEGKFLGTNLPGFRLGSRSKDRETSLATPMEMTMKIRDIMTKDIELVHPDTLLRDAAQKMREADTGFLPVGEDDRLVGTLTDRDITIRSVAEGHDPKVTRVREAMGDELVYCFEDQETSEAAELMAENDIRRLPVLSSDKRLVGVVSLGDLAAKTGDDDIVGQTVQDISSSPPKG